MVELGWNVQFFFFEPHFIFQLHLIVGILGFSFNMIALVVFLRLGRTKPYYVIAIFETLTDLITSMVAIYSGVFLVIGNCGTGEF